MSDLLRFSSAGGGGTGGSSETGVAGGGGVGVEENQALDLVCGEDLLKEIEGMQLALRTPSTLSPIQYSCSRTTEGNIQASVSPTDRQYY